MVQQIEIDDDVEHGHGQHLQGEAGNERGLRPQRQQDYARDLRDGADRQHPSAPDAMQDDGHRQAGAQADEGNQEVDDADELRGAEQRVGLQRHERDQDRPGERIAGEEDDERARPRVLDVAEQDRGVDSPHFAETSACSDSLARGQTPRLRAAL